MTEAPAAASSCFRRIEIKSLAVTRKFDLILFASEDVRFLTTQVFDIKIDPLEEERKRKDSLRAALNPPDAPSMGPANAPVTITVFSDFQCPYCSGLARTLREDVMPKERNVRLVFRYFPLQMHPWAQAAAEAEVCAQRIKRLELSRELHDYHFRQSGNHLTRFAERDPTKTPAQAAKFQKLDERQILRLPGR